MKLYLGAGKHRLEGFKHADIYPYPDLDYVFDATQNFPIADNECDLVYTQDFLEHIPQISAVFVINEIYRILKKGGQMHHVIPNAGSMNDFASPTHLSHWNLWTFRHFTEGDSHFETDREFMGWIGDGFTLVSQCELNEQNGVAQSIDIIMQK